MKHGYPLPPIEIELILAHILGKTREYVIAHPEIKLSKAQKSLFLNMIKRRQNHEPLAYILGHKEFHGLDFEVDKNTLVPRPETELLVEEVKNIHPRNKNIIDVGTGSGNIIISLAKNIAKTNHFYAIDISPRALRTARKNARRFHLEKDIKFFQGNLLAPFMKRRKNIVKNSIITANLPYLDKDWKNLLKSSDSAGLKFEPEIALHGGDDGLDLYRKISTQIRTILKNQNADITLLCEIGHLQKKGMEDIFHFAHSLEFKKDLAGKWRMAIAHFKA